MELNENLAKLIFREFEDSIKGTDIYNHEGSMWLIFTEERKWVVEFTKQKTLWYNYKHFNDILMLFGMELNEGAEYIKKWYEDKFIFNVVKNDEAWLSHTIVDNVIDNGVKDTTTSSAKIRIRVEDTIQNGVKDTMINYADNVVNVEDTIQNGVKDTMINYADNVVNVEDTVQNGVKQIKNEASERYQSYHHKWTIDSVIQEGVKEIIDGLYRPVKDTIQNGVKEVEYYDGDAEVLVNDAIENGVKEISSVDCEYPRATTNVIKNGVKKTYSLSEDLQHEVDDTIMMGVKYMMSGSEFKNNQVEDIIKYSEKL